MNDKALNVLEQYDPEVRRTWKGRNVWFCDTSNGLHVLQEYRGSEEKLEKVAQVLKELESVQFFATDLPVRTKEGTFIAKDEDGSSYLLKKWHEGRECDPRSETDVCRSMESLAIFHEKAQGVWEFSAEEERQRYEGMSLVAEFEKHTRELKKVRQFMRTRRRKTAFESYYLQIIPQYLTRAEKIGEKMKTSGYEALFAEAVRKGMICHGEFTQHNVLFDRSRIYLTNFEHARLDLPCMDAALFLRKVMEKQDWRTAPGARFLHAYEVIRPLKEAERLVLALRLAYPEKLWKLANHYYHTAKAWSPERDLVKLQLFVSQQEARERFVRKLFF